MNYSPKSAYFILRSSFIKSFLFSFLVFNSLSVCASDSDNQNSSKLELLVKAAKLEREAKNNLDPVEKAKQEKEAKDLRKKADTLN